MKLLCWRGGGCGKDIEDHQGSGAMYGKTAAAWPASHLVHHQSASQPGREYYGGGLLKSQRAKCTSRRSTCRLDPGAWVRRGRGEMPVAGPMNQALRLHLTCVAKQGTHIPAKVHFLEEDAEYPMSHRQRAAGQARRLERPPRLLHLQCSASEGGKDWTSRCPQRLSAAASSCPKGVALLMRRLAKGGHPLHTSSPHLAGLPC